MAAGNSVYDEIKEQTGKMKGQPLKVKAAYFWEYYKIHTAVAIIIAIFLGSLISTQLNHKNYVMYAVLVNGYPMVDLTDYMNDFKATLELTSKKDDVYLMQEYPLNREAKDQYSIASVQKYMVQVAAGELDAVFMDKNNFEAYGSQSYFYDLREVLPADLYQYYEENDMLLYLDQIDVAENEDKLIVVEEHVPVGIEASHFSMVNDTYAYLNYENECYLGCSTSSKQLENFVKFLQYIEETPVPLN